MKFATLAVALLLFTTMVAAMAETRSQKKKMKDEEQGGARRRGPGDEMSRAKCSSSLVTMSLLHTPDHPILTTLDTIGANAPRALPHFPPGSVVYDNKQF